MEDDDDIVIIDQPPPLVVNRISHHDDTNTCSAADVAGTYVVPRTGTVSPPTLQYRQDRSSSRDVQVRVLSVREHTEQTGNSQQNLSCPAARRVAKQITTAYLLLDSDSDYSDVEWCDDPAHLPQTARGRGNPFQVSSTICTPVTPSGPAAGRSTRETVAGNKALQPEADADVQEKSKESLELEVGDADEYAQIEKEEASSEAEEGMFSMCRQKRKSFAQNASASEVLSKRAKVTTESSLEVTTRAEPLVETIYSNLLPAEATATEPAAQVISMAVVSSAAKTSVSLRETMITAVAPAQGSAMMDMKTDDAGQVALSAKGQSSDEVKKMYQQLLQPVRPVLFVKSSQQGVMFSTSMDNLQDGHLQQMSSQSDSASGTSLTEPDWEDHSVNLSEVQGGKGDVELDDPLVKEIEQQQRGSLGRDSSSPLALQSGSAQSCTSQSLSQDQVSHSAWKRREEGDCLRSSERQGLPVPLSACEQSSHPCISKVSRLQRTSLAPFSWDMDDNDDDHGAPELCRLSHFSRLAKTTGDSSTRELIGQELLEEDESGSTDVYPASAEEATKPCSAASSTGPTQVIISSMVPLPCDLQEGDQDRCCAADDFPVEVSTLQNRVFQENLQMQPFSEPLLSFLLRAQDAKVAVCSGCGDAVLANPSVEWGSRRLAVYIKEGVLMVTLQDLVHLSFFHFKMIKHPLMGKESYPGVWSSVQTAGHVRRDAVSLVFLSFITEDIVLHQQLSQKARERLLQAQSMGMIMVGNDHKSSTCLRFPKEKVEYRARRDFGSMIASSSHSVRVKKTSSYMAYKISQANSGLHPDPHPVAIPQQHPAGHSGSHPLIFVRKRKAAAVSEAERMEQERLVASNIDQVFKKFQLCGDKSSPLIFPCCPCSALSDRDQLERSWWCSIQEPGSQINKKIDNLGVVRLMRCNVFCFMLNGKLYLSTAELEQRSLMPPGYHLVTNNLFLFSMEEKKDACAIGVKEKAFLSQFFSFQETGPKCVVEGLLFTPRALQQIYLRLTKNGYNCRRHSKAIYYVMTLGHHCAWSLQVTPPTTQLHGVPGYEHPEGIVQRAAMIIRSVSQNDSFPYSSQEETMTYYDGGGGTAPDAQRVRLSLNHALLDTIEMFGLSDMAEPFCSCDIKATELHRFSFLSFDGVEMSHVTEMVGLGEHLLHCWKRSDGFYVSLRELVFKSLVVLNMPYCCNSTLVVPAEKAFLSSLGKVKDGDWLLRLDSVSLNYVVQEGVQLAPHKFRIKLWPHQCPAEVQAKKAGGELDENGSHRQWVVLPRHIAQTGPLITGEIEENGVRVRGLLCCGSGREVVDAQNCVTMRTGLRTGSKGAPDLSSSDSVEISVEKHGMQNAKNVEVRRIPNPNLPSSREEAEEIHIPELNQLNRKEVEVRHTLKPSLPSRKEAAVRLIQKPSVQNSKESEGSNINTPSGWSSQEAEERGVQTPRQQSRREVEERHTQNPGQLSRREREVIHLQKSTAPSKNEVEVRHSQKPHQLSGNAEETRHIQKPIQHNNKEVKMRHIQKLRILSRNGFEIRHIQKSSLSNGKETEGRHTSKSSLLSSKVEVSRIRILRQLSREEMGVRHTQNPSGQSGRVSVAISGDNPTQLSSIDESLLGKVNSTPHRNRDVRIHSVKKHSLPNRNTGMLSTLKDYLAKRGVKAVGQPDSQENKRGKGVNNSGSVPAEEFINLVSDDEDEMEPEEIAQEQAVSQPGCAAGPIEQSLTHLDVAAGHQKQPAEQPENVAQSQHQSVAQPRMAARSHGQVVGEPGDGHQQQPAEQLESAAQPQHQPVAQPDSTAQHNHGNKDSWRGKATYESGTTFAEVIYLESDDEDEAELGESVQRQPVSLSERKAGYQEQSVAQPERAAHPQQQSVSPPDSVVQPQEQPVELPFFAAQPEDQSIAKAERAVLSCMKLEETDQTQYWKQYCEDEYQRGAEPEEECAVLPQEQRVKYRYQRWISPEQVTQLEEDAALSQELHNKHTDHIETEPEEGAILPQKLSKKCRDHRGTELEGFAQRPELSREHRDHRGIKSEEAQITRPAECAALPQECLVEHRCQVEIKTEKHQVTQDAEVGDAQPEEVPEEYRHQRQIKLEDDQVAQTEEGAAVPHTLPVKHRDIREVKPAEEQVKPQQDERSELSQELSVRHMRWTAEEQHTQLEQRAEQGEEQPEEARSQRCIKHEEQVTQPEEEVATTSQEQPVEDGSRTGMESKEWKAAPPQQQPVEYGVEPVIKSKEQNTAVPEKQCAAQHLKQCVSHPQQLLVQQPDVQPDTQERRSVSRFKVHQKQQIQPLRVVHLSGNSVTKTISRLFVLEGEASSSPVMLGKACQCSDRKPGVFPSFSFLQCMFHPSSPFTIIEHVGQAIIRGRLTFCFYKYNKVFFSSLDLESTGVLTCHENSSAYRAILDKGNNLSRSEREFLSFHGILEKPLVSVALLQNLLRQKKPQVRETILLHQVGHICHDSASQAHKVQRMDSYTQHRQTAWARAFRWHQVFVEQQGEDQKSSAAARSDRVEGSNTSLGVSTVVEGLSPLTATQGDSVVCVRCLDKSTEKGEPRTPFISTSAIGWCSSAVKQEPHSYKASAPGPAEASQQHSCAQVKQEPQLSEAHSLASTLQCPVVVQAVDGVKQMQILNFLQHERFREREESGSGGDARLGCTCGLDHSQVLLQDCSVATLSVFDKSEVEKVLNSSMLEGVILGSGCKRVKVIQDEAEVIRLLGDSSGHQNVVLTGTLTCEGCQYMCLNMAGRLYVNWAEVVHPLTDTDQQHIFKQAQCLHAFLYLPPVAVNRHFSCCYGGDLDLLNSAPWVCVNTLVAIYNLGSGILPREKMLKRFVNVTPQDSVFSMFLMIKNRMT